MARLGCDAFDSYLLVELDSNPRTTDPEKIPQIKVMATWVEGKPAYTGGKAAAKAGS